MSIPVMSILLAGLVVSAAVCAIIRNLLKASIALAAVSAILAVIMFLMDAPLAGAFELSVCAGLITVVFISAISMTRLHTKAEEAELEHRRHRRFILLPVLLCAALAGALWLLWPQLGALLAQSAPPASAEAVSDFFWNRRQADILGQIAVVLVGVFGVLIFFKEEERGEK